MMHRPNIPAGRLARFLAATVVLSVPISGCTNSEGTEKTIDDTSQTDTTHIDKEFNRVSSSMRDLLDQGDFTDIHTKDAFRSNVKSVFDSCQFIVDNGSDDQGKTIQELVGQMLKDPTVKLLAENQYDGSVCGVSTSPATPTTTLGG